MKREIIVIGVTHHNTLSMVRCIGQEYGEVELLLYASGKKSYISKSKNVIKAIFVESVIECFDYLMKRPQGEQKAILISCTDQIAQLLDQHQAELIPRYEFFQCKQGGNLTRYMNKQMQVNLASSVGLNTPVSYEYKHGSTLKYVGNFPCVVKPVESYIGGKKIVICKDESEIRQTVDNEKIDWQIQELVNKETEIVLTGVSVNSEIIIPGYVQKHREIKGGTTYSTIRPFDKSMDKLVECSKKMIRAINYEGLFGFEFIFDGNNYWFLELNLRNDATCYTYKVAGVNLPLIYLKGKEGDSLLPFICEINQVDSMVEPNDFSFVISRKVSLSKWIKQLSHSKCKYLYDREDLKPLLYYIAYTIQRKFSHKKEK